MSEKLSNSVNFSLGIRKVVKNNRKLTLLNKDYFDVTELLENKIEEVVTCETCGKVHSIHEEKDSKKVRYMSVFGNIHVNFNGGIIGNGNWDDKGVPVTHYCPKCLIKFLKGVIENEDV